MNLLTEGIYNLIKTSRDTKRLSEAIAAYLVETRQTKDVDALLRGLESLRLHKDGLLEIQVTSARPLGEATKEAIKTMFDARKKVVYEEQDPSLLGGVKVRAHDKEFDTSVRTRLQRLKVSQEL